jgi:transposase
MPKRINIKLSEEEKAQLERWVKNPPRPYLRERARAILRIAGGTPIMQVAQTLRIRIHRTAVSEWVHRFEEGRVEGLKIRAGRGRKPAFSPSSERGGEG